MEKASLNFVDEDTDNMDQNIEPGDQEPETECEWGQTTDQTKEFVIRSEIWGTVSVEIENSTWHCNALFWTETVNDNLIDIDKSDIMPPKNT